MKLFKSILLSLLIVSLLFSTCEARTPWTSKPPLGQQIDWSNPLTNGLVGCWIFNEGSGRKYIDLTSRSILSPTGSPVWNTTILGKCVRTPTVNADYLTNNKTLVVSAPMTLVWYGRIETTNGTAFCNLASAGGDQWDGQYLYYSAANQQWSVNQARNNTFVGGTETAGNSPTNSKYMVVGRYVSADLRELYVNGAYRANNTQNNTPARTNQKLGIHISARSGTAFDNGLVASCAMALVYNRILSPQEIMILYQEPYCFIKPQTDWNCLKAVVSAIKKFIMVN